MSDPARADQVGEDAARHAAEVLRLAEVQPGAVVVDYIPDGGGGEAALVAFNAAVFQTLKPGGRYVVIDHNDGVGTGISGTERKHRIEKAAVVTQVLAAGFTLIQDVAVLANPQDDHRANVFDPAIRGRTDKFVLVFRKPD